MHASTHLGKKRVRYISQPTKSSCYSMSSSKRLVKICAKSTNKALSLISPTFFSREKRRPKDTYNPITDQYTCHCFYHVEKREKARRMLNDMLLLSAQQEKDQNNMEKPEEGSQPRSQPQHLHEAEKAEHQESSSSQQIEKSSSSKSHETKITGMEEETRPSVAPKSSSSQSQHIEKLSNGMKEETGQCAAPQQEKGKYTEEKREEQNTENVHQDSTNEELFYDCCDHWEEED